jgi:hypothetical protein
MSWSLVQRSPTGCLCLIVCVRASNCVWSTNLKTRRLRPELGCWAKKKKGHSRTALNYYVRFQRHKYPSYSKHNNFSETWSASLTTTPFSKRSLNVGCSACGRCSSHVCSSAVYHGLLTRAEIFATLLYVNWFACQQIHGP